MKSIKWEEYRSKRTPSDGQPMISIFGNGGFGFSSGFFRKFIPEKPKYVSLRFAQDMDNIYIGFVFSEEKRPNSLKVSYPKSNGVIIARGFFNQYKINSEKFRNRYMAEEAEDKTYMITLKK